MLFVVRYSFPSTKSLGSIPFMSQITRSPFVIVFKFKLENSLWDTPSTIASNFLFRSVFVIVKPYSCITSAGSAHGS